MHNDHKEKLIHKKEKTTVSLRIKVSNKSKNITQRIGMLAVSVDLLKVSK